MFWHPATSNNPVVFVLVAATLGGGAASCQPGPKGSEPGQAGEEDSLGQALDPGEGWIEPVGAGAKAPRSGDDTSIAGPSAGGGVWSIVLATFSSDTHQLEASESLARMQSAAPQLREARVHSTARGSMILYGSYSEPSQPAAQRDLKRIKEITIDGRRPFARALLNPITAARGKADVARSPHDLMRVREIYPEVDPLYTLQVAAWSDFDSGSLSREEVRSRAEAYCRELRGKGFEAYVHHSAMRTMSVVTVGLFDHHAFDPQSGLNSPELEALKRKFPVHLVNGEELQEPVRAAPGTTGKMRTRPQRPMLVKVPLD